MSEPADSKQSRSEQLRRDLVAAIESGEYKPGDLLPTVRDLGRKYGISHVVASVALNQLVRAGYVVKRRGAGSFVAETARVPGVIQVHSVYGVPPALQQALRRFEEACPRFTVRVVATQREADVLIFGTSGTMAAHQRGYLLPLEPLLAAGNVTREDFLPLPLAAGTIDGATLALPYSFAGDVLMFRSEFLPARDRERIAYWSLEELLEALPRLTQELSPDGIRPLNQNRSFINQVIAFFPPFGARIVDAEQRRCRLGEEPALAAFAYDQRLGQAMPGWQPGQQCTPGDLLAGRLAMWRGPSTVWTEARAQPGMRLAPMPYGRCAACRLTGEWLGVAAAARNPALAWQLVAFLVSPAEQQRLARAHVLFPGRRDAFELALRTGRGAYDVVGRTLMSQQPEVERVATDDLFYLDQALAGWRQCADLPALLHRCAMLLEARLFQPDAAHHQRTAHDGLI